MTSEETADEVKVFRRNDVDDQDSAQSSLQLLEEDKKDVALETELETEQPGQASIGSKQGGAFSRPSPFTHPYASLASPNYTFPPLMMGMTLPHPFLMSQNPYGMLSRPGSLADVNCSPLQLSTATAALSPMYAAAVNAAAYYGSLSPSFNLYQQALQQSLSNPSSPLHHSHQHPHPHQHPHQHSSPRSVRLPNPLHSLNRMRLPNHIGSPTTSNASINVNPSSTGGHTHHHSKKRLRFDRNKDVDRIKKPLNAFMLFMKKNRQKLIEEESCKDRQSAELNKELGRRWREMMSKEDRQPYFDLAKEEERNHKEKYPQWSARENYAINRKKKRRPEKSLENLEMKKCRARFGLANQERWCKHCKRKKRCLWAARSSTRSPPGNVVSSTTPGTPRLGEGEMGMMMLNNSPYSIGGSRVTSSGLDSDSEDDDDHDHDHHLDHQHLHLHNTDMQPSSLIP